MNEPPSDDGSERIIPSQVKNSLEETVTLIKPLKTTQVNVLIVNPSSRVYKLV